MVYVWPSTTHQLITSKTLFMKRLKFHAEIAEFIGFGIAWQYDRAALCLPFFMIEISWRK